MYICFVFSTFDIILEGVDVFSADIEGSGGIAAKYDMHAVMP